LTVWSYVIIDTLKDTILEGCMKKHIRVILDSPIAKKEEIEKCQECQTPCRSACKTSMTVGNLVCEVKKSVGKWTW
jgi:predicted ribosomally synthesized six-cysteine peptide SCIFF